MAFLFWMEIKRLCHMQAEMQLSTKWKSRGDTVGLFVLSILLFARLFPPCTYCGPSFALLSLLISDHKGLPASDAGAAARPRRVHKLHPVPVAHPWGHRLLHLQGLVAGLHGESDAGPAGLSWRWLHHCASLPHQHRDVPGHESQVCKDMWNRFLVLAMLAKWFWGCSTTSELSQSRLKYLNNFLMDFHILDIHGPRRMNRTSSRGPLTFPFLLLWGWHL